MLGCYLCKHRMMKPGHASPAPSTLNFVHLMLLAHSRTITTGKQIHTFDIVNMLLTLFLVECLSFRRRLAVCYVLWPQAVHGHF